jgi:Asp-tRNA(Asn)/Glu-tRNA(Gln) amidotransferase A subunit family amidase
VAEEDLCYLGAVQAIERFEAHELSPVELMTCLIERDQRIGGRVNALTDRYADEALKAASIAERRWMNGEARALEGVPVAVKDAQRVAGQRTTFGSPIFRNNVERVSDPMIERLTSAGAIIHARTTTSELCVSGICTSPLWDVTANPWNLAYGPGGSSGGSGAALAAGLALVATGTDMGGSIRVPASACGVVGYKPPHGRNPDGAPWNLEAINHCGPMARSVGDIGLIQNVVSGAHPLDRDSLRDIVHLPRQPDDVRGLRVAYSIDLGYREVDPSVRRTTLQALDLFREIGCQVNEVAIDWDEEIDRAFMDLFGATHLGRSLLRHAEEHPDLLSDDMRRVATQVRESSCLETVSGLLSIASRMQATFGPLMEAHDVFICPTMTIPAVPVHHRMFADDFRINGKVVDPEFGYSTTHQFNILSDCPVLSVPSGFADNGVPTGIQIVGRAFDDLTVYRAGFAFEQARGPWYRSDALRPRLGGAA